MHLEVGVGVGVEVQANIPVLEHLVKAIEGVLALVLPLHMAEVEVVVLALLVVMVLVVLEEMAVLEQHGQMEQRTLVAVAAAHIKEMQQALAVQVVGVLVLIKAILVLLVLLILAVAVLRITRSQAPAHTQRKE